MNRPADIESLLEDLRQALQAAAVCLWTAAPGRKAHPVGMAPAAAVTLSFWPPAAPGGRLYIDDPKNLARVLPLAFRAPTTQPPHVALLQVDLPASNNEVLGLSVLWNDPEATPLSAASSLERVAHTLREQLQPALAQWRSIEAGLQMQGLADALPQALVIVSGRDQRGYLNPAAARLLALKVGDVAPDVLSHALQRLVASASNAEEVSGYALPILRGQPPVGERSSIWHFAKPPKALRVTISATQGPHEVNWVWLLEDVSAETALREQLLAKEKKFRAFYLSLRDAVVFYRPDGGIADCNEAFRSLLKITDAGELLQAHPQEQARRLGWDHNPWQAVRELCVTQRSYGPFEKTVTDASGRLVPVASSAYLLTGADNETLGAWEVLHDLTQRKQAEAELILSAEAFARYSDGVILTDASGVILTVNDAFTRSTGYTRDALRGQRPSLLKSGRHDPAFYRSMREQIDHHGWWQGGVWNRRSDGELFFKWLTINAVRDASETLTHYVGVYRDVATVKRAQTRIDFMATHDELTGLPNHILFQDRLELALKRPRQGSAVLAVVILDLVDFHKIRNVLGHKAGEAQLQALAARLAHSALPGDTVARRAGDQFALLMEAPDVETLALRCQQVVAVSQQPLNVGEGTAVAMVKLGISVGPMDGTDAESLLLKADTALQRARQTDEGALQFFSGEMIEHLTQRFTIETGLRQALLEQQLVIQYQPQVSAQDSRLMGCEALIRWRHNGQLVPPAQFIPVAEETGLIIPITEWILAQVARQIQAWDTAGLRLQSVSVNISARHFQQAQIVESFMRILHAEGVTPQRICLEITEGALADPVQCEPRLQALKQAGFEISIDDFGTGYSSLSYLKRFRLDELKIDRSFVKGIETDRSDRAIVEATLAMAHRLGMRVVAEGVETPGQHQFLQHIGCDLLQGYWFSRPIDPGELVQWQSRALEWGWGQQPD